MSAESKKEEPISPDDSIKVEESYSGHLTDTEPAAAVEGAEPPEPQSEEEKLRSRVAELEDRLLRSIADFDNFRKRSYRQMDEAAKGASDRVFADLLDVLGNLDRAMAHCKESSDVASLKQGMEMIHSQFIALLTKYEITPIDAIGKPFDPNLHEALMQIDSDEHPANVVAAEINRGYRQGERVLRHSQVAVSKGPASNTTENTK